MDEFSEEKKPDSDSRLRRLLSDPDNEAHDSADNEFEIEPRNQTSSGINQNIPENNPPDQEDVEQAFEEGNINPEEEQLKIDLESDLNQVTHLGDTPVAGTPLLDSHGFPLPNKLGNLTDQTMRVESLRGQTLKADPFQTIPMANKGYRVQPNQAQFVSAQIPKQPTNVQVPPNSINHVNYIPPPESPSSKTNDGFDWKMAGGCLLRAFIFAIFGLVIIAVIGFSVLIVQYYNIARGLPNIEELQQKASHFETTRILDRNGNLLYEMIDPNAGRRTYVTLDKISPYLVAATIATEDKEYYSHPGYNVMAILRAFYQNANSGDTVSGASTITQQLARNLLFTPEERAERSYQRKVREAILAAELTRRYSKDEILEIYLNENYYGNLSYGVEAASETYFHTTAQKLSLGQAAFLAGLPQAPSVYDIYTNREPTLKRQSEVLVLMYKVSQEQGCIYVSNSPQRVCVDAVAATEARSEIMNYDFPSPNIPMNYPHWVNYIRQQLEAQFDPQTIYRSGFTVYTTLDSEMQTIGEQLVHQQVQNLKDKNVNDGALIAIKPDSGEILAMVGSADFYDDAIDGQVNMAVSPRQPGSSIKPITYLAAFEKGWTPATLIWDVPSEFPPSGIPEDPSPPYVPKNYDDKFHGPVTVRTALANSYNVPAVKTLQFVGIYDDPNTPAEEGFIAMAKRLGITTLTRPDYGLSLTLGGGEVSLLELTGAFAILADGGQKVPLVSITKITDKEGNTVFEASKVPPAQVIRPEHAYLITSILSDNKARTPMFGSDSVLKLPFPAAVKTGTTNDFRDNWTIGYTPQLTVGVWVGNANYKPMNDVSGVSGAAPIWAEFMKTVIPKLNGDQSPPFTRPQWIIEKTICAISGTEPSQWCPKQTSEIFAADQPPLPKEQDLWQKIWIDTWTRLRASDACGEFRQELFVINITDPFAIKWVSKDPDGKAWAKEMGFKKPFIFTPPRACQETDPHPKIEFIHPKDGDTINTSILDIYAIINATQNFKSYQVDFGIGSDPDHWENITAGNDPSTGQEKLTSWDISELPSGLITLRITLISTQDTSAELKIHLNLQVPTPTPAPTATPQPTETPTLIPTLTDTPVPSVTPFPSETPAITGTP